MYNFPVRKPSGFITGYFDTDPYFGSHIHCHRKMKRSVGAFHVDPKSFHLTLDVIFAWVCMQYGDKTAFNTDVPVLSIRMQANLRNEAV